MNQALINVMASRIVAGLKRQSISTPSQWAERYRIMGQPFPGPWTFKHHPWLREIHDCKAEFIVNKKGAQLGLTETALNMALKAIDIDAISVMYVLPASKPDASDFSSSRFDPALEMSDHLNNLFTDVKNVYHKRAGAANLYLRGSKSRSQLKSVPVGLMIFDEVDEMDQDNIPLALERTSGQLYRQVIMLSTPTIDNCGIDKYFHQTTEEEYHFRCPHCGKYILLTYPDSLVIKGKDIFDPMIEESYYICTECKGILKHEDKENFLATGKWVGLYPTRASRGFTINQLYATVPAGRPGEIAKAALKMELSAEEEQEFWNSKLGKTHVIDGARVEEKHIQKCIGLSPFVKLDGAPKESYITMGIDIGKWIHLEIDQWFFDENMLTFDINLMAKSRIIMETKILDFDELDKYMHMYNVAYAVIDAQPEVRKASEFANRFYGKVKICYYTSNSLKKVISIHENTNAISVDRTSWLDLSLGRIIGGRCFLPKDLSQEYRNHIKALIRVYEKDKDGNPFGKYVKADNESDHFAHAHNYAEIALPLGLDLVQCHNITEQY